MPTIIGKTSIAPCGHTGEHIIGTYVKCSQGCEGPAIVPRRGEPGHVENCACKPCQFRRNTKTIVLRDKGGKDWYKVDWDGVTDEIKGEATKSGDIRHYHFLDADGKIIGKGITSSYVEVGTFRIRVKTMMDSLVACSVASRVIYQGLDDILGITITLMQPNQPAPTVSGVWHGLLGIP